MCYSVQPRNKVFLKGYGFLYFAKKNMDKNIARNKSENFCGKVQPET